MRSAMLEVIHQDYVTVARAKGLDNRGVLYRHALRNALIPMVTVIGLQLPRILSGAVIIEQIFAWPGSGSAGLRRDRPPRLSGHPGGDVAGRGGGDDRQRAGRRRVRDGRSARPSRCDQVVQGQGAMADDRDSTTLQRLAVTRLAALTSGHAGQPLRRFLQNRLAVAGLVVIVVFYVAALGCATDLPLRLRAIQAGMRDKPPSAEHWLGTDRSGRDVWSRLIKGGQISLAAGFAAVVIIMTIGVMLGGIAGYLRRADRRRDHALYRYPAGDSVDPVVDHGGLALFAGVDHDDHHHRPDLVAGRGAAGAGAVAGPEGSGVRHRGAGRRRAAGADHGRHLLPNTLAIIIVEATLWLSYAILLEASLSYLGLGVQIPTPSWGNMLQDGQRELLYGAWWLTVFPGSPSS